MFRRGAQLLVVVGVTALASSFGAMPVTAATAGATTWTVTNPNGDGSFAMADGTLVLRNTSTGDVISCSAPAPGDAGGFLKSGTYDGPPPEADNFVFWINHDHCSDAQGADITVLSLGNWYMAPLSYDPATGRATGEAFDGNFTFLPLYVQRPDCQYAVRVDSSGFSEADFTYTNSSSTLTVSSGLRPTTLSDLSGSGCGALAHEGDVVTFDASYQVTPAVTIVGT